MSDMQMAFADSERPDKAAELSRFRGLGPGDLEAVSSLETRCFKAIWGRDQLSRALGSQGAFRAFGLERAEDGVLPGYCLLLAAGDEMEILNIAIDPEYRRQGLGRQLLGHVLQWAVKAGIENVLLEVRPSNAPALALYAAFGFQRVGLRRGYYQDTGEDALVLCLEARSPGADAAL